MPIYCISSSNMISASFLGHSLNLGRILDNEMMGESKGKSRRNYALSTGPKMDLPCALPFPPFPQTIFSYILNDRIAYIRTRNRDDEHITICAITPKKTVLATGRHG